MLGVIAVCVVLGALSLVGDAFAVAVTALLSGVFTINQQGVDESGAIAGAITFAVVGAALTASACLSKRKMPV